MVNNIRRFLRNKEEEMEMNQVAIGIKYVFQGLILKNWIGINFGILLKYVEMNRIIIKYYV